MTDRNVSRRTVLAGLLAGAGQTALAGAPQSSLVPVARPGVGALAPVVPVAGADSLIKAARLGGKISYVVADGATGKVLEAHNPILGLPPASVAKAMTAQYALESLGQDHRFATRLLAMGDVENGRLNGDLVLLGGGDPTLDSTALAQMAAGLKATGLREVSGRFLVASGGLPHVHQIDAAQPAHLSYNPAVSGLNLNFNRVHFEWKKTSGGYTVLMDARTVKYRPQVMLAQMKIIDRGAPVYTYANGGGTERWTVARGALGKGGSRWLPVRQPELYAGEVFQTFARAQGIKLPGPILDTAPMTGTVLVDRQSPKLVDILRAMLKHSTNLTAEVTGLSASVARGATVGGLGQSAREMSRWMRDDLGAPNPRFVDHSGLGDKSRISATDMVSALVSVGTDSMLASLMKKIEPRDSKGKLMLGEGRSLRAKTGTLNFVSGLAGYVNDAKGRDLVFAIFSADLPRRAAISRAERERPAGARGWSRQARALQWRLLERWVRLYG